MERASRLLQVGSLHERVRAREKHSLPAYKNVSCGSVSDMERVGTDVTLIHHLDRFGS